MSLDCFRRLFVLGRQNVTGYGWAAGVEQRSGAVTGGAWCWVVGVRLCWVKFLLGLDVFKGGSLTPPAPLVPQEDFLRGIRGER